jgi:hypothetical protein
MQQESGETSLREEGTPVNCLAASGADRERAGPRSVWKVYIAPTHPDQVSSQQFARVATEIVDLPPARTDGTPVMLAPVPSVDG